MIRHADNNIKNSIPLAVIEAADLLIGYCAGKYAGWVRSNDNVCVRIPFYALFPDCVNKDCVFVLERHLDGSGVFVRYYRTQIII